MAMNNNRRDYPVINRLRLKRCCSRTGTRPIAIDSSKNLKTGKGQRKAAGTGAPPLSVLDQPEASA